MGSQICIFPPDLFGEWSASDSVCHEARPCLQVVVQEVANLPKGEDQTNGEDSKNSLEHPVLYKLYIKRHTKMHKTSKIPI